MPSDKSNICIQPKRVEADDGDSWLNDAGAVGKYQKPFIENGRAE
jgi:hypothetical protein